MSSEDERSTEARANLDTLDQPKVGTPAFQACALMRLFLTLSAFLIVLADPLWFKDSLA
jgi:hypothetical protein